jgi:hypothetical protein
VSQLSFRGYRPPQRNRAKRVSSATGGRKLRYFFKILEAKDVPKDGKYIRYVDEYSETQAWKAIRKVTNLARGYVDGTYIKMEFLRTEEIPAESK